jgi:hypothetical protein
VKTKAPLARGPCRDVRPAIGFGLSGSAIRLGRLKTVSPKRHLRLIRIERPRYIK